MGTGSPDYVPCRNLDGDRRHWYAFLIVSLATPFVLAVPLLAWRLFAHFTRGTRKESNTSSTVKATDTINWETRLSFAAFRIHSDQTPFGQVLKLIGVLFALGSLIIYFRDTAPLCQDVEMCHEWLSDPWWNVDLAFNCFFALYFILRFLAAHNKLRFLFEMDSIVDYFTVPVAFVAVGLDRNWHGLRFLRIVNMLWLVHLLHRFRVVRSAAQVELARLVVYITMAVIIGAGAFLLLECSGDPWDIDNTLQQNGTFWNYAYFSVVTISTVGYGDIGCKTVLGKIFNCFFIFACLFFIATFISTAASLVPPPRRYPKFDHSQYFGHVLVCGSITHAVAKRFLEEFYEEIPTGGPDTKFVIFLHPEEPDEEMILLLRDYQSCVEYIKKSPYDDKSLADARASYASACIILADQKAADPDTEDAINLLAIIAIKNYCPTLRVSVQVLTPGTTAFLRSYPAIDTNRGDVVLNQRNIELALVGMTCLVPGFSTFFCDLLIAPKYISYDREKVPELYARGCQNGLYCVRFSAAFLGMSFPEAAQLCFEKLNILLIAVYMAGESEMDYYNVTPNPPDVTITENLRGHVIAPTRRHAKLIEIFCRNCHADLSQPGTMGPCQCSKLDEKVPSASSEENENLPLTLSRSFSRTERGGNGHAPSSMTRREAVEPETNVTHVVDTDREGQTDSTGMFYWQTPRDFEDCLLSLEEANSRKFDYHIAILILDHPDTTTHVSLSLHHMIAPLRASIIPFEELSEVLIVGNRAQLEQEWATLRILPKVWMIAGNCTKPPVIRSAQLQNCRAGCLMSSSQGLVGQEDTALIDKEVLILTLRMRNFAYAPTQIPIPRPFFVRGVDVPLISYLGSDKSIRFLSQDSSAEDYRYTVPFMSGQVLAASSLESLLIPAYYNPSLIRLLSSLVFGGVSSELNRVAAEGSGLQPPRPDGVQVGSQLKTTIKAIDLDSDTFRAFADKAYGDLFTYALKELGIVCVGLYRLFILSTEANDNPQWKWGCNTRYVACNPPADLVLDASDIVYALMPATII